MPSRPRRPRVDDMRELRVCRRVSGEMETAAIGAAGGDGAVSHQYPVYGCIVFGGRERIGNIDHLSKVSTHHDIAADIQHDPGRSCGKSSISSMAGNITLGEGSERNRSIGEVNSCAAQTIHLPVGLLHGFDGTLDLGLHWLAMFSGGPLPKANSRLRGSVQRTAGRFTPVVEKAQHFEKFRW